MFPAFAHFRRTATGDTVLNGKEIKKGEKVVMWYVSSNRDESRYEDPDRFDVLRNPEHQAFGAGGRHFCLGTALARLELKILLEETLARYPDIDLGGRADLRRVGLPQPAEDAAGQAHGLVRAGLERPLHLLGELGVAVRPRLAQGVDHLPPRLHVLVLTELALADEAGDRQPDPDRPPARSSGPARDRSATGSSTSRSKCSTSLVRTARFSSSPRISGTP